MAWRNSQPGDGKVYPVYNSEPSERFAGPEDTVLIFHHINSTGGSSFGCTLARIFHERVRQKKLQAPAVGNAWEHPEFSLVHPDIIDKFRFCQGHGLFGVDRFFNRPCTYLTMLREPVLRMLSMYHFLKTTNPRQLGGCTLEKWVESPGFCFYSQAYLLFRCTRDDYAAEFRGLGDEARLAACRETIAARVSFVGITDLFEESLFLACDYYGLSPLRMWPKLYATPGRPGKETLTESLRARIAERMAVDVALYEEHRAALERRIAKARFGPMLEEYCDDARETHRPRREDGGAAPRHQAVSPNSR